MPPFQNKTFKFQHAGMNWNRPIDLIPPEQSCYAKNIRLSQEGVVTARHGLTQWAQLTYGAGDTPVTWIHSISRMNNYSPEVDFDFTYVFGADQFLFVGSDAGQLADDTLNPVDSPYYDGAPVAYSGNPFSIVDMAPVEGPTSWKYIGDSTQLTTVGYYPGDDPTTDMARALTMGLQIPVSTTIPTATTGNLLGDYQWCFAYRRIFTGARSNPSAPTRVTLNFPLLSLTNQGASMTLPTTPIDPQTGSPDLHILVDVYRFGGTIQRWAFVGTGTSGSTFVDKLADAEILTAPSPPEITDPITGVTRFNLYQPFPIQDIKRSGTGTVSLQGNGTYRINSTAGDFFNLGWVPGTPITIGSSTVQASFTVYQVLDTSNIEIAEDVATVGTGSKSWTVAEGAITAGQPLAHIWGPFSTGQTGAFIFGIGNENAPGNLYWTNGNDPDSTDVANSVQVTSPTEPLMNGCIYDGACLVWSTERMFRVYPSLTLAGQFTVEEIPGAKGMWGPYSLAIQTTGVTDQHVTWLGKDGIYNWSINGGLESMTDGPMYPFFIHDNEDSRTVESLFPFITGENVTKPDNDLTKLKYHRITWFDGYMYYDFPMEPYDGGPVATETYGTLVFDTKIAKGWVSADVYYLDDYLVEDQPTIWTNNSPITRGIEIAANNMKLGLGSQVADYTGIDDMGNEFTSRFITRAEDMGDPRGLKLWGDYMLDCAPLTNNITCLPRTFFDDSNLGSTVVTGGARSQFVLDFASGLGQLTNTFGLDLTWSNGVLESPLLYQWQPSWVPKPENIRLRATDWTDDGEPGDKWVYGCLIEANTYNAPKSIQIHADGDVVVTTLVITHDGQSTKPYYFPTPVITHQLRCVPEGTAGLELFRFIPKWNKKPELTRFHSDWTDDGKPQPKWLQGFVLEGDTAGNNVSLALYADQVLVQTFTVNHAGQLEKPYAVTAPPIIHEMKLIPTGANIRYLDTFKLSWMYVVQPEFTSWQPDYTPSDPTAYHGIAIEADTHNLPVAINIISEGISVRTLTVTHDGRVQKAYSFGVPFTSTEVKIQIGSGSWAQYPDWKIRWIGYPKPDLAALYTDWTDDGYQGAKFFQGFILHANTAGLDTTMTIQYDGGTVGGVFTKVNHAAEMEIAYSFEIPFIAHQVRAFPDIPIRYTEPWKIRWIWEPAPELAKRWITQTTSHGLRGWYHHRDSYIAVQSYDVITLRIFDDAGGINSYILPSTGGLVQKFYEPLAPQKAKLVSYSLISCLPFRLFQKDCEVRVAQWNRGAEQEYTIVRPFGGPHFERGATI